VESMYNWRLRLDYLKIIKTNSTGLLDTVTGLEPFSPVTEPAYQAASIQAVALRNGALRQIRLKQTPLSRSFAEWLKENGRNWNDLLSYYTKKKYPAYENNFDALPDEGKVLVYEDIIEASGRGRALVNKISTGLGVVGVAMIVFTLGMMVYDIWASASPVITAVHDALAIGLSAAAGYLAGNAVAAALAEFGAGTAFVVGNLVGLIIGVAVGMLIDWLFSLFSGADKPAYETTDSWSQIQAVKATPPDGSRIVNQVMHE